MQFLKELTALAVEWGQSLSIAIKELFLLVIMVLLQAALVVFGVLVLAVSLVWHLVAAMIPALDHVLRFTQSKMRSSGLPQKD